VAPALRSLPSRPPINRDHARGHERKSEFCFEIGNETRNPRRRDHVPVKCCGVACARVAKKPNHKPGRISYLARFSAAAATSRIKRISMWFLLLCAKDLFVEANAP